MIKIPDPVLIIYIVASLLGFGLRFVKDGVYKQISFKPVINHLGLFAMVFLPFLGLLFLAQHFGVASANSISYFAGASILTYLLSGLGLPSYLRGILLAGAAVALTSLAPAGEFVGMAAALTGLVMVKLAENLGYGESSDLDDIVPPFIWLTSAMWLSSVDTAPAQLTQKAGLLLGIMAVSFLMRFIQGPFIKVGNRNDDRILVKRTVLSVSAGLAVLCVVIKVLNLVQYQNLAILCGAGYFVSYLYKDLSGDERYSMFAQPALRMLFAVGILTLVAMRFYGTFGLLALAPTAMVAPISSAALFPGIYFASRALMQVYLQHFNLNVTGINLNHAYTGAAQYGGLLLGVAMLLLLKEKMERRTLLGLTLAACIITPVLSNFLLHSEPSCSLFTAALTSCFLLAVVGPSLQAANSRGAENLALTPALMISSGILTSGLLEMGNTASISVKSTVLSYGVLFVILLSFLFWFFFQKKEKQTPATANGEGS